MYAVRNLGVRTVLYISSNVMVDLTGNFLFYRPSKKPIYSSLYPDRPSFWAHAAFYPY